MKIDVNSLTMAEMQQLQDLVKRPISAAFAADRMDAQTMRGLWYIVARRDDPELRWEDTADITMGQFTAALEDDDGSDPTQSLTS